MTSTANQLHELKHKIAELENQLASNKKLSDSAKAEEDFPLHDVYTWKAPDRVAVKHGAKWYTSVVFLASICVLYALLTLNFFLIIAIIAIVFLLYAMDRVPPRIIEHAITNKGIRVNNEFYYWHDINYFWVSERDDNFLINIELTEYRGRMILLVGEGNVKTIVSELIKHENYQEPEGFNGLVNRLIGGRLHKITDFESRKP